MIPNNMSEHGEHHGSRDSGEEISKEYIYDGLIYQFEFSDPLLHRISPDLLRGSSLLKREELMMHVREAAEQARATFIERMESSLDKKSGDLEDDDLAESPDTETSSEDYHERRDSDKRCEKHGKVFVPRESLLNKLSRNKNIQTVYNILLAILFVIIINSVVTEYLNKQSFGISLSILVWSIDKVPFILYIWCGMMLWATAVFYSVFTFWAHHPDPNCGPMRIPNVVWLTFYILGLVVLLVYPPCAIVYYNLPPGSTLIVLIEQIRIGMKIHGFMREVTPRAFSWKQLHSGHVEKPDMASVDWKPHLNQNNRHIKEDKDNDPCPDFSLFLYFLFAPTLIYRNSYPMTSKIRWKAVRKYFGQCIVCGFYMFFILEYFCMPITRDFAKEPYTLKDILRTMLSFMLPATLCLFLMFYLLLHAWMNAFAEMTKFADRQFYKDWWNSQSYSSYFRTWNIVVHDWLYTYIYKDLTALGVHKEVSLLCVFVLSSLFHEYVLSLMFRFCYPVLLVVFFISGVVSMYLPGRGAIQVCNTLLWFSMFIGNGLIMCLYNLEWYARINCPSQFDGVLDLFVPRSFSCSRLTIF